MILTIFSVCDLQMDILPYDTKDEQGGERYMPLQVPMMIQHITARQ